MEPIQSFESRKREHLLHALRPVHQAVGLSGLDRIHLVHEALPDIDFDEVCLGSRCLGRVIGTPFYVAGMTAGHEEATRINRALALACQERGWAMGVGSQRRELEGNSIDGWQSLREEVPRLLLFANLGISQVITASSASPTWVDKIRGLVDAIRADALVVHANALQEVIQPEGTPRFRGAASVLRALCTELNVPVVLKETGCGFSKATLSRLVDTGLAAIDVSGLGGTHWGRIEGTRAEERAGKESVQAQASLTFAGWGESTVDTTLAAVEVLPSSMEIWASGGVRTGLDAAKLIALGAHRVGYAQPALQAALESPEALRRWMETQEYELKVALFCTGCKTVDQLRERENVWKISAN